MKKGFTLVELLAVISIIAILLLVIIPKLNNTLSESKSKVQRNSVNGIVDAANVYYTKHIAEDPDEYNFDGSTNIFDKLKTKGDDPHTAVVRIKPTGEVEVIVGFEDDCYYKEFDNSKIKKGDISFCIEETIMIPE